jgi:small subunit ribosomal protein S20
MRQSERKRLRNRPILSRVRTLLKAARAADPKMDAEGARRATLAAVRELDRAVSAGVLHRNNAARRKSRLLRRLPAA